jgi:hypothetical protein
MECKQPYLGSQAMLMQLCSVLTPWVLPQALPSVWILFALPVSWGWFLRCHLDIALLQIHIIKENIGTLMRYGMRTTLSWIPGHANIAGNEIADQLAKEAALLVHSRTVVWGTDLCYSGICLVCCILSSSLLKLCLSVGLAYLNGWHFLNCRRYPDSQLEIIKLHWHDLRH